MTAGSAEPAGGVSLSLNAQLLRAGLTEPRLALTKSAREDPAASWFVHDDGGRFVAADEDTAQQAGLTLLVRLQEASPPVWQQLFNELGVPPFQDLPHHTSAGAILFVRVAGRLVAWTFGTGARWISRRSRDPRFGLLVALNALAEAGEGVGGFLAAHLAPTEGDLRDASLRLGSPTRGPIARYDVTTDRLKGVVANTPREGLERVSGAQSLRFSASISAFDDFETLSRELVDLRNLDAYKDSFSYVENIVEEDDPEMVNRVLTEVWQRSAPDTGDIEVELAWWDDVREPPDDRVVTHFRLPGERRNTSVPPAQRPRSLVLTWQGVRTALANRFEGEEAVKVLRKELRFFDSQDDEVGSCEVQDLLVADLTVDGVHYTVSEGQVFRVDAEYVDAIDRFLSDLVVTPSRLPPYTGGAESTYNAASGLAVLDRQLIVVDGSHLELCDLVDGEGRMIFVKRRTRASAMSHLWAQVVASLTLLRRSREARRHACDRLAEAEGVPDDLPRAIEDGARDLTIVFAILGATEVRHLTLLARVPLRAAIQRLQDAGAAVEIELVPGPGNSLPYG